MCNSQHNKAFLDSIRKDYQAKEQQSVGLINEQLINKPVSAYYQTGKDLDGDGNYQLGGRKALGKPKHVQECNEAGIVAVSIEVDRNGRVIKVVPGLRGTTNNTKCLLDKAKENALATKFNADAKAPSKQIGKIVYRFSLSD